MAALTSAGLPPCFLDPLLGPGFGHLLGDRLWRLSHQQLDAQTRHLLGPPPAPPPVARASTRRCERRARRSRTGPNSSPMPSWSGTLALWTRTLSTSPSVSTCSGCAFFPPPSLCGVEAALVAYHSRALGGPGVSYVPALGCGFLPSRAARRRSRSSAFSGARRSRRCATA